MGHYTGPKARVNRAVGSLIYEESGAARALERRNQPPGMHTRRPSKPSIFGLATLEKKKLKHYYGLGERELRRLLAIARKRPGNTGEYLLKLCERRLDNVARRAGFTSTRPQARQAVAHGHLRVNGIKVDKPSYLVRPGDVLTVRDRPNLKEKYRGRMEEQKPQSLDWLQVDPEHLRATVTGEPDISLPIEIHRVIEFYR